MIMNNPDSKPIIKVSNCPGKVSFLEHFITNSTLHSVDEIKDCTRDNQGDSPNPLLTIGPDRAITDTP